MSLGATSSSINICARQDDDDIIVARSPSEVGALLCTWNPASGVMSLWVKSRKNSADECLDTVTESSSGERNEDSSEQAM